MRAAISNTLRVSLACGLFACVLTASGIAHSEDESVTIEASRSLYRVGETAEFTVTNSRAETIFVGGCGPVQVQAFEAEQYVSITTGSCVSEGTAVAIPPGTHPLTVKADVGLAGKVLRAAVAYGWGCEEGKELSQSRCKDFATAYSGSFRIGRGSAD